jgi:hypothetical protein
MRTAFDRVKQVEFGPLVRGVTVDADELLHPIVGLPMSLRTAYGVHNTFTFKDGENGRCAARRTR